MSSIAPALAFIPGLLSPIFAAYAMGIRSAGARPTLRSIDYKAIDDIAAFHRWLGTFLLLLPAVGLAAAAACVFWPTIAVLSITLFFLATMLVTVLAIGFGTSKFANYSSRKR